MTDTAVVIPCHNGAAFVATAIDSVLRQTRQATSVVVVDDASRDESVAIAERFTADGHPVRVVRLQNNGGPGRARNVGLQECDEAFVAFLDADDWWLPEHLGSLVPLLEAHTAAVLAFAGVRTQEAGPSHRPQLPIRAPADLLDVLLFDNFIPQSAVVARRWAVLEAGGYVDDMRHSEDYDLWLRMALRGPFIHSGSVSAVRRTHEGQATTQAVRMYHGAWRARRNFVMAAESRGQHDRIPPGFLSICQRAYERDLGWAWQSRNRALLREVLALAPEVPGSADIARSWRRRERLAWPAWRAAAWVWDAQPAALRDRLRALRSRVGTSA